MADRDQALAVAERFGENLRRVRRGEDLSQERLAKRASLHRTAIGLLEQRPTGLPDRHADQAVRRDGRGAGRAA